MENFKNSNGEKLTLPEIGNRKINSLTILFKEKITTEGKYSFFKNFKFKKYSEEEIFFNIEKDEEVRIEIENEKEAVTLYFVILKEKYNEIIEKHCKHKEHFVSEINNTITEINDQLIKFYIFLYPKRLGVKNLKSIDWN